MSTHRHARIDEAICLMGLLNMHADNKYCNKGCVAPLPSNCFEAVFYVYSVSARTVGTHTSDWNMFCEYWCTAVLQEFLIHNSGVWRSASWLSCCLSDLSCLPHIREQLSVWINFVTYFSPTHICHFNGQLSHKGNKYLLQTQRWADTWKRLVDWRKINRKLFW